MIRIVAVAFSLLVIGLAAAIFIAWLRWRAATDALIASLERSSESQAPITSAEMDSLPPPVARYLRAAVGEQVRPIGTARVRWRGSFFLRGWRHFEATQIFHARPPGFVWDARIAVAPGVNALVRDGFVHGMGSMRASIAGAVPVVDVKGTPEIAAAALQRWLAETIWFPTALLPRNGVRWTAIDSSSARATLTAGGTTVSLDFHFGSDGPVERICTPSRFRDVKGTAVPTPWEARVHSYVERDGLRVPSAGEAAWLLSEGRFPYWRGELVDVRYERE